MLGHGAGEGLHVRSGELSLAPGEEASSLKRDAAGDEAGRITEKSLPLYVFRGDAGGYLSRVLIEVRPSRSSLPSNSPHRRDRSGKLTDEIDSSLFCGDVPLEDSADSFAVDILEEPRVLLGVKGEHSRGGEELEGSVGPIAGLSLCTGMPGDGDTLVKGPLEMREGGNAQGPQSPEMTSYRHPSSSAFQAGRASGIMGTDYEEKDADSRILDAFFADEGLWGVSKAQKEAKESSCDFLVVSGQQRNVVVRGACGVTDQLSVHPIGSKPHTGVYTAIPAPSLLLENDIAPRGDASRHSRERQQGPLDFPACPENGREKTNRQTAIFASRPGGRIWIADCHTGKVQATLRLGGRDNAKETSGKKLSDPTLTRKQISSPVPSSSLSLQNKHAPREGYPHAKAPKNTEVNSLGDEGVSSSANLRPVFRRIAHVNGNCFLGWSTEDDLHNYASSPCGERGCQPQKNLPVPEPRCLDSSSWTGCTSDSLKKARDTQQKDNHSRHGDALSSSSTRDSDVQDLCTERTAGHRRTSSASYLSPSSSRTLFSDTSSTPGDATCRHTQLGGVGTVASFLSGEAGEVSSQSGRRLLRSLEESTDGSRLLQRHSPLEINGKSPCILTHTGTYGPPTVHGGRQESSGQNSSPAANLSGASILHWTPSTGGEGGGALPSGRASSRRVFLCDFARIQVCSQWALPGELQQAVVEGSSCGQRFRRQGASDEARGQTVFLLQSPSLDVSSRQREVDGDGSFLLAGVNSSKGDSLACTGHAEASSVPRSLSPSLSSSALLYEGVQPSSVLTGKTFAGEVEGGNSPFSPSMMKGWRREALREEVFFLSSLCFFKDRRSLITQLLQFLPAERGRKGADAELEESFPRSSSLHSSLTVSPSSSSSVFLFAVRDAKTPTCYNSRKVGGAEVSKKTGEVPLSEAALSRGCFEEDTRVQREGRVVKKEKDGPTREGKEPPRKMLDVPDISCSAAGARRGFREDKIMQVMDALPTLQGAGDARILSEGMPSSSSPFSSYREGHRETSSRTRDECLSACEASEDHWISCGSDAEPCDAVNLVFWLHAVLEVCLSYAVDEVSLRSDWNLPLSWLSRYLPKASLSSPSSPAVLPGGGAEKGQTEGRLAGSTSIQSDLALRAAAGVAHASPWGSRGSSIASMLSCGNNLVRSEGSARVENESSAPLPEQSIRAQRLLHFLLPLIKTALHLRQLVEDERGAQQPRRREDQMKDGDKCSLDGEIQTRQRAGGTTGGERDVHQSRLSVCPHQHPRCLAAECTPRQDSSSMIMGFPPRRSSLLIPSGFPLSADHCTPSSSPLDSPGVILGVLTPDISFLLRRFAAFTGALEALAYASGGLTTLGPLRNFPSAVDSNRQERLVSKKGAIEHTSAGVSSSSPSLQECLPLPPSPATASAALDVSCTSRRQPTPSSSRLRPSSATSRASPLRVSPGPSLTSPAPPAHTAPLSTPPASSAAPKFSLLSPSPSSRGLAPALCPAVFQLPLELPPYARIVRTVLRLQKWLLAHQAIWADPDCRGTYTSCLQIAAVVASSTPPQSQHGLGGRARSPRRSFVTSPERGREISSGSPDSFLSRDALSDCVDTLPFSSKFDRISPSSDMKRIHNSFHNIPVTPPTASSTPSAACLQVPLSLSSEGGSTVYSQRQQSSSSSFLSFSSRGKFSSENSPVSFSSGFSRAFPPSSALMAESKQSPSPQGRGGSSLGDYLLASSLCASGVPTTTDIEVPLGDYSDSTTSRSSLSSAFSQSWFGLGTASSAPPFVGETSFGGAPSSGGVPDSKKAKKSPPAVLSEFLSKSEDLGSRSGMLIDSVMTAASQAASRAIFGAGGGGGRRGAQERGQSSFHRGGTWFSAADGIFVSPLTEEFLGGSKHSSSLDVTYSVGEAANRAMTEKESFLSERSSTDHPARVPVLTFSPEEDHQGMKKSSPSSSSFLSGRKDETLGERRGPVSNPSARSSCGHLSGRKTDGYMSAKPNPECCARTDKDKDEATLQVSEEDTTKSSSSSSLLAQGSAERGRRTEGEKDVGGSMDAEEGLRRGAEQGSADGRGLTSRGEDWGTVSGKRNLQESAAAAACAAAEVAGAAAASAVTGAAAAAGAAYEKVFSVSRGVCRILSVVVSQSRVMQVPHL